MDNRGAIHSILERWTHVLAGRKPAAAKPSSPDAVSPPDSSDPRGQYDGYGYARDDRYLANLYEHEHDQRFDRHAGGPQFEETPHPSLWQRVKGAFSGKGPKNWTRLDERIREDVCERLADHPHIDASDIEVVVKDGEVTLVGLVDHRRTKRLAEDVTEEVRGVKDIHNQIKVKKG